MYKSFKFKPFKLNTMPSMAIYLLPDSSKIHRTADVSFRPAGCIPAPFGTSVPSRSASAAARPPAGRKHLADSDGGFFRHGID